MVAEMGREAFDEMQRLTLLRGERLHWQIENHLLGDTSLKANFHEGDEISQNHKTSISSVLPHFAKPYAIESHVVHPTLKYQGYIDCCAVYKKYNLVLVDWKTSKQKKKNLDSTYDNPIQLAAYIGAFNHDPRYQPQIDRGMLVFVYNDGTQAKVFNLTENLIQIYWEQWLERLQLYRKMEEHQLAQNNY